MDEKKYSQLYQALLQEVLQFHNGNQRRIRKGMLSLLLVPLVFLVLLFLSEGSRVIFLLLWIVSIAVEYIDYEMQNKVKKITKKEVELDQLTPLPSAMPQLLPMLLGRSQEPDLPPDPPQEEQESFAQSAAQAEEDLDQLLQGLRGTEAAPAAPEPAPVSVPENPAPVPPVSTPVPPASQAAPQPVSPDLNQTLAGLQTDMQQLARGLESLSHQLGRKGGTEMRNIWKIFRSDWQRLTASVVAVVVVMGLCLIPCLYAWFNIFSNWDPYGPDSTSNIRVAVTSEDEGYELLGLKLNIGSMVLDGLKSNDQMGWDFVDSREEALEGVRSGKYYAALIVPSDFTGDFVSILDTDLRHPQIQYYENQKKNAIAPKITNKAKTAVQDEINATVVETVTDAVTTVSSVCKALGLDADDVSQGIIEKLGSAQQSLLALENTLSAMQTLVDQTDSILACAGVVSDDLNNIVKTGDLSGVQDALNRGVGRLNEAEAEIARQLEDIDNQLDVIAADLAAAMGTAEDVADFLAGPAQLMDQRLEALQQQLEKLRDYADNYPAIQERLGNAIYHIGELRDLLKKLEDPSQLESWNQEVQAKIAQIRQDLREAALRISESVNQRVEELNRNVQEKLQAVQNVFDNVSGGLTALGDKLGRYQDAIRSTDTTLGGAIQLSSTLRGDLGKLSDDVERIVTSDGFRRFLDVLENNPEELAGYLSDPIAMETVPVYEITTYGSAMAPYYIMLALFVGSLLTATMIHVNAPIPPLPLLRPWQRFFGRYQLFFLVGMVQALVTGLGCVYYIGMQCLHPGLFLLACCVCSLNFTMMNFALVYALDNIGMALSVIIMVIQVAGSGGSYPIDVLPEVFQKLYVLMPFHYGMDMIRETIAGRYENVYWTNLAVMAGMCVLFAVLGMLLYYPARPLNRMIAHSKEKSGIM